MAIAVDAIGTGQTNNTTGAQSASIPITIGGGANRALVLYCAFANDTTGIAASIGGTNIPIIAGADGGGTTGTVMLGVQAPPTGAQTISITWTNNQRFAVAAVSFTGVDQTTPFNHGTFNGGGGTSLSVTSTSGDLTTTGVWASDGSAATTNQTKETFTGTSIVGVAVDIGPGTGTTTHTWNTASFGPSGANLVQASGGGPVDKPSRIYRAP